VAVKQPTRDRATPISASGDGGPRGDGERVLFTPMKRLRATEAVAFRPGTRPEGRTVRGRVEAAACGRRIAQDIGQEGIAAHGRQADAFGGAAGESKSKPLPAARFSPIGFFCTEEMRRKIYAWQGGTGREQYAQVDNHDPFAFPGCWRLPRYTGGTRKPII